MLLLLAPFAPHITEELWHELGNQDSVHEQQWPAYDEAALVRDSIEIAVQVNGKIRSRIEIPANLGREEMEKLVKDLPQYTEWLGGKVAIKTIAIPGKLVNIVVK